MILSDFKLLYAFNVHTVYCLKLRSFEILKAMCNFV